jgi:PKD domain
LSRIDRGTDAKVDRARTRASSDSPRTRYIRRLRAGATRRNIAFLTLLMLLATVGVALAAPTGSIVTSDDSTSNTNGITKFGPVSPDHGFPDWYRDKNGIELEPCMDARDPNCNAPPVPVPEEAPSFPDNFPDEFFYMLADANMTANGGNVVLAEYALEGAFATAVQPGDQMVFGRTRYRIRGGVTGDTTYKITNPYGVDYVKTDAGATELFVTEDVGITPGAFGEALAGQVGPFLKWTNNEAPAGYVGDPATLHTVTGSPFNTNFVKIEGPGIGGTNNPNPCPGLDANTSQDCIYTDQFSLTGKLSTKGGVDVGRATYSRNADGTGTQLDVMAESKAAQDIVVQDPNVDRRFPITPLVNEGENYFAHLDVQGELPATVDVVNRADVPKTVKHVKVTDHLTGTALYDTGTHNLHVTAESSDKTTAPVLKVPTYNADLAAGAADIAMQVPPNTVKVASKQGGTVDVPVQVQGPGLAPLPLAANAGADQTVEHGVTVTLDASGSTGNIDTMEWTSADGIALSGATTDHPTFTAPSAEGDYTFTVKVTGPDGTPPVTATSTDTVVVHVNAVQNAVAKIAFANAATDPATPITVPQNTSVTLDGTTSVGAAAFSWTKVSGPVVNLGTADQPKLTFTFPKTARDLVLRLTVRNPGVAAADCTATTCSSVDVTLRPESDTLAITKARFVTTGSRWVVDGTATSTKANHVQVYSGLALDPARKIGTSDVLTDGTWSVDVRDSAIPVTTCQCVTVVSDRGGRVVGFPLEKPQNLPPTTVDPGTPPAPEVTAATLAAPVPLLGAARLAAAAPGRLVAPAAVRVATVATTGVPVTFTAPAGATLARLRVLTTANKALFSTFKKVKGGTKVKIKVRSAKLRKRLRAGKRYIIEVRAGTAKNRLGKATRKVIRIRA